MNSNAACDIRLQPVCILTSGLTYPCLAAFEMRKRIQLEEPLQQLKFLSLK
jgi:hypothetical protein